MMERHERSGDYLHSSVTVCDTTELYMVEMGCYISIFAIIYKNHLFELFGFCLRQGLSTQT